MRVLYIPSGDDKYGAPKSMMELVKNLKERHNVEPVILTCSECFINEYCEKEGIESHVLGQGSFMVVGGSNTFRKIVKHAMYPYLKIKYLRENNRAKKKIEEILAGRNFDIVHTNVNRIDIGGYFSLKHNVPHVWHLREFGKEDYNCMYLRRDAIEFMNKSTTRFIAISKAVKQGWINKGLDDGKIDVVYNGIDLSKFTKTLPERAEKNHSKIKLVFAGIISETKGQQQLIRALSLMSEEQRNRFEADIWGGGREAYIDSLKKETEKYGLQGVINFKGYTSELPKLLSDYDIGVVASRAEAFGRVTAEYMAAGLCVVASDRGANPEIVDNNLTGLLYEYGNAEDLKNKLLYLAENQNLMMDMRKKAFVEVRERFSMDLCADNVYREYEKAIGERK